MTRRPPRPIDRRHESPAYSAGPALWLTTLGCALAVMITMSGGLPRFPVVTSTSSILGVVVALLAAWAAHEVSDRRGDDQRKQVRQAAWTLRYDYRLVAVTA